MTAKYEIEIPDGVIPEGWEPVGYKLTADPLDDILCSDGRACKAAAVFGSNRLILRKIEPVRESRWLNLYAPDCDGVYGAPVESRAIARNLSAKSLLKAIVRIDYENDRPVNVALEPAEGGGA